MEDGGSDDFSMQRRFLVDELLGSNGRRFRGGRSFRCSERRVLAAFCRLGRLGLVVEGWLPTAAETAMVVVVFFCFCGW